MEVVDLMDKYCTLRGQSLQALAQLRKILEESIKDTIHDFNKSNKCPYVIDGWKTKLIPSYEVPTTVLVEITSMINRKTQKHQPEESLRSHNQVAFTEELSRLLQEKLKLGKKYTAEAYVSGLFFHK